MYVIYWGRNSRMSWVGFDEWFDGDVRVAIKPSACIWLVPGTHDEDDREIVDMRRYE